jgi:hypothetical protein
MEIQDQQDLEAVVEAQEALLDQALQEAADLQEETVVIQVPLEVTQVEAQAHQIVQEGTQAILQVVTQEETQEEIIRAIAGILGVTIRLGIIRQIMITVLQIQIHLLGMEIAAMIIRQEKKEEIQAVKEKKVATIHQVKRIKKKAARKAVMKALKNQMK